MALRRMAYFLAGTLLGVTAVALTKSEKGQKVLASVVQGTCQVTETLLERVEVLKEDISDYLAEAKYAKEVNLRAASKQEQAIVKKASTKKTSVKKSPAKKVASTKTMTVKKAPQAPTAV